MYIFFSILNTLFTYTYRNKKFVVKKRRGKGFAYFLNFYRYIIKVIFDVFGTSKKKINNRFHYSGIHYTRRALLPLFSFKRKFVTKKSILIVHRTRIFLFTLISTRKKNKYVCIHATIISKRL